MSANTAPIWSIAGSVQFSALITTVKTDIYNINGTVGTDIFLIFTADTNGNFVDRIRIKYINNSTTVSVACVLRIYLSSVNTGTPTTSNTVLFTEIAIPVITPSTTSNEPDYEIPMGIVLNSGQYILAAITVGQGASTGFQLTTIAGKY